MPNVAIKDIPTSENGWRASEILNHCPGHKMQRKGRGHRFPGVSNAQALPLKYAARFTMYFFPEHIPGEPWQDRVYFQYKGFRRGKPVIRRLNGDDKIKFRSYENS